MFRAAMLAVLAVFNDLRETLQEWIDPYRPSAPPLEWMEELDDYRPSAPPLELMEGLDDYRPSAPPVDLFEQRIAEEIVFFNRMSQYVEDYADEKPAHLYPTGKLLPAQDENYKRLLVMISDSGLPIHFSKMYKINHSRIDDSIVHNFEIIARYNAKRRKFKMTIIDDVNHIFVQPEYSFDSQSKTLYKSDAKPECKIYDLFSIFTEDDSRKWKFKTVRWLTEERRRKQKRLLAVMLASHPRLGEAAPMGKVNEDLLESIALLSLS